MPTCVQPRFFLAAMLAIGALLLPSAAYAQSDPARASTKPSSISKPPADVSSDANQNVATSASTDNDDDGDDDGDETRKPASPFVISLHLDSTGRLVVSFIQYGSSAAVPSRAQIKAAMESAVSCRLEDDLHTRQLSAKGVSSYAGYCSSIPHRELIYEGVFQTAPIVDLAREMGVKKINLAVFLPAVDVAETKESPVTTDDTQSSVPRPKQWAGRITTYDWNLDKPIPTTVTFRSGYKPVTSYSALWLLALLLAPLALVHLLGRRALQSDVPDKAAMWFSYMRTLSLLLNVSLFVWWGATEFFHLVPMLRLWLENTRFAPLLGNSTVTQWLDWIPPMVVWLLCYRMSHPVQEKLRGLHWTKKELTLQALYSLCAGLIPIVMFLTGFTLLGRSGSTAALWFVAAFAVRVFAVSALLKVTGMQPRAVTAGPLRDHAFTMAGRIGVKLQQVYLIPSGKGQMANAFASGANNISFTDFLLERMSQAEIDFVLAHELTHLKLSHPQKLMWVRLLAFFVGDAVMTGSVFLLPGSNFAIGRYLLLFASITVITYLFSRRFEFSADAGAVELTGDPRSAISALFKLSQLNMMPTQWTRWSEKWLSHPSSVRRAQAIARKANILVDEIPAIAREGSFVTPINATRFVATPPDKLFSSQYKRSFIQTLARILLATICVVPSVASVIALHLAGHSNWQVAVLSLAVPAALAALIALLIYSPRLQRGDLGVQLKQKLTAKGIDVDKLGGIYVGLAPGVAPRTYESVGFWDIGYLFFSSDRLYYWGEEAQFSLRRDQIGEVRLGPGLPSFVKLNRVYISWHDEQNGGCGVFNFGTRGAGSALVDNHNTIALSNRVIAWRNSTMSSGRALSPPLDALTSPAFRAVTAAIPKMQFRSKKFYNELVITGWISALIAMLFGLRFHFFPYLTASASASPRVHELYRSPGMGWFVVVAAITIRFLLMIPGMRYKDEPVLVAQPAKVDGVSGKSTTPTAASKQPSPQNPVPVG